MTMQHIIQSRRRALGLTQDQVAQALGVSVPAVSKWETGASCPDIALLPPLARLLGTDLNALFDFESSMTAQEIHLFCQSVVQTVRVEGIAAGFDVAAQKLREFPRDEMLRHVLTVQLDSLLTMSGLPQEQASPLEARLLASYDRLTQSPDSAVRDSAYYMLAGRFLRRGECEKAQEALDHMRRREDLTGGTADRLFLQVEIDRRQGRAGHAVESLQSALLPSVNRVQTLLLKLLDLALDAEGAGDMRTARDIAARSEQLVGLFELWPCQAIVGPLEIAMAEKDAARCVSLLREMLNRMMEPWKPEETALFARVKAASSALFEPKQTIPAMLSDLERNPADFLREREDYRALIDEYRRAAEAL